ncbi:MAG: hypothetical protein ACI9B8_003115 [Sulfitobacter sp.]|jgi:hypothetical protein
MTKLTNVLVCTNFASCLRKKSVIWLKLTARMLALSTLIGCAYAAPSNTSNDCAEPGKTSLVCLNSPDGLKLIEESQHKNDYWLLSETFTTQETQTLCGVASAVTVLNALPIERPIDPEYYPHPYYTQISFFSEAVSKTTSLATVQEIGMTLPQLQAALLQQPVEALITHAAKSNVDVFRKELIRTLGLKSQFLIINFDRRVLEQAGLGHFSPVAAYHAGTDRVLLMDVARYKYKPAWVPVKQMFQAMIGTDSTSKLSRGWMLVQAGP